MNQPASTPTPASAPGTLNVRVNPKALIGGVMVGAVLLGFGFKLGATGSADATDAPPAQVVDEEQPATLDEDLPALDPTEGPEIAPTPTTLAETPIELDPVVTTVAETVPPPVTEEPSGGLEVGSSLPVVLADGSTIDVPLPEGWVADENGNAHSEGPPWMNVFIANFNWGHEEAISKYVDYLAGEIKDFDHSKSQSVTVSSNIVAFSYFEYGGTVPLNNGGSRSVYGFVQIGTGTNGTTTIVDWWSDSDVTDEVARSHFKYFAAQFGV